MVYYGVHDALVRPMPGTPMGNALAQSWSMSKDGLVYEFVLRRGVKFHNGDVMTADDVKFSFERYRGASAALLKQKVAAVEIAGPGAGPLPPQAAVARLHDVLRDARDGRGVDRAEEVRREGRRRGLQEGSRWAPARIASSRSSPAWSWSSRRIEGYWRKPPIIKTLVFKVIPDDATRLAALKRGEVDVAYGLTGPLAEEVRRTRRLHPQVGDDPGRPLPRLHRPVGTRNRRGTTAGCAWPPTSPSTAQAINQASYLGLGRISASFIPQALEFYWKPPLYPHDPKRARQLLAEAGYANGFDGGDLTSEAFAGSGIGEPVVNDLGAVGIRLKLRLLERAAFLKQHSEKTLKHVVLAGSGAPGNAATRLEQYAVTGGLYAYGSYPEVDGLFKAQAVEVNPRVRRQILEKMQQIIHERVMFAPILEYAYFVSIGPQRRVRRGQRDPGESLHGALRRPAPREALTGAPDRRSIDDQA